MRALRLNAHEKRILMDLAQSADGLNAYTLHRRYGLSAALLVELLRRLLRNEIIEVDGSRVSLTANGESFVWKSSSEIRHGYSRPWRVPPEELRAPRLKIDTPVLPWIPLLDKTWGVVQE